MQDNDKTDRELKLRAMLAEYEWIGDDQKLYNQFHRRDAQIFGAVIGSLLAFSTSKPELLPPDVLSLTLPSVVFVYWMLQIVNLHVLSFESKRRAEIEEKINREFGDVLMTWESRVRHRYLCDLGSPSVLAGMAIFALMLVVFLVFSVQAFRSHGVMPSLLHACELVVILGVGIQWVHRLRRQDIMGMSKPQSPVNQDDAQQ